jgi:hypothetical protein
MRRLRERGGGGREAGRPAGVPESQMPSQLQRDVSPSTGLKVQTIPKNGGGQSKQCWRSPGQRRPYKPILAFILKIWPTSESRVSRPVVRGQPIPARSGGASELCRLSDRHLSAKFVPTFVDVGVSRGQRGGFQFSRPEPLLFFQVAPHLSSQGLSGPHSRPTATQKIW